MRHNKPVSVIGFREKESKYYFHCSEHLGVRLQRVKDSWLCPECGPTIPAIRIVDVEQKT